MFVKACFVTAALFFGLMCFVAGAQYQSDRQPETMYINGSLGPHYPGTPAYRDVAIGDGSAAQLVQFDEPERADVNLTAVDSIPKASNEFLDSTIGDVTEVVSARSDVVDVVAGYGYTEVVLNGGRWSCSLTRTIPRRTECHDYATGPKK